MMLRKLLDLPNPKSMVICEDYYTVWVDILSNYDFTYVELDNSSDFVKFFPDKNCFMPIVPTKRYFFVYQKI